MSPDSYDPWMRIAVYIFAAVCIGLSIWAGIGEPSVNYGGWGPTG